MDLTTKFDQRLQHVPEPWRGALVDVIDTAEAICLGLQQPSFGVSNPATESPELVAALTRLACERSNAAACSIIATDSRLVSISRTISGDSINPAAIIHSIKNYWRTVHDDGAGTEWNQWSGGVNGIFSDAPVPVAFSDRLPNKNDCNEEGFYWCNGKCLYEDGERFLWVLSRIEDENEYQDLPPFCTHWLPYGALPQLPIPSAATPHVSLD